jgi:drug/metabolite transporter (DMT)-like permease
MSSQPLRDVLPILALLYSATLWGVLWYPLRLLNDAGVPGLWSTLVMFSAALAVGIWIALPRHRELRRQPVSLLGMAAANGWCNVAFVLAILDGSVVRVTLLFFLSPIWATLLARVFLQEHVSARGWRVLALAMAGALVMLWDPELGRPWPHSASDWLAISSGVAFALSNIFVRRMQGVALPIKTAAAWAGVAGMALLWITTSSAPLPQVAPEVWIGAAALGMGAILTMTFAVQYGVTHMPVHRSAIILLFELVAGAVSSQLLTDEVVLPREWIGGALIMLAGYFSARSQVEHRDED